MSMACGNSATHQSEYLKDLETYRNEAKSGAARRPRRRKFVPKPDPILLKLHPDLHPLSCEQQSFFIQLTEGAFGFNEHVRIETLQILGRDYHVKFLAPYLCRFVKDAIDVNIVFPDLSLLIYSVRMIKSVMVNPHVDLKEHLHLVLPGILSCVLSKRISKYSYDNHWTLRDFSAQVVAALACIHTNQINQIKARVIKIYVKAIQDLRKPLTTIYGALKGLSSFGDETVKLYVLPLIPVLSRKIHACVDKSVYLGELNTEHKHIKYVTDLILTITGPTLLRNQNTNDGGVSYIEEFGYLGYTLYSYVKNLEKIEAEHVVYLICG